ncbi:uncharacterized protein DUF4432 [Primorskyibacter sedentarius]|uniref:Uncharacterized protein DUF4432 n=1 Tax=Primorskyibacter sedentarius TaxID=745311 RepID=A0A4R3J3I8_9RHOB|nr:DUF4432 family protein [Primorskyibacter sedentarius]TCS59732.1 uncharacterized protein DUF4432 [Primorskyibacter sedentarius]
MRAWAENVADLRQLASVRRITLDDGPERGVRALSFDTGGGLAFWVLADRSLDIGPLSFRGMPLAWQHPAGFIAPGLHDAQADGGTGIQRSLSGFLVTCGLDNARQPKDGLPLHGNLPMTPARVTAWGEDWDRPDPLLYVEGDVVTAHLRGACFRLHRRIEAPAGAASLTLIDRVENIGPEPAEMHVLYHTNFGFPMVDAGTTVTLDTAPLAAKDGESRCHPTPGGATAEITRPACADWPGVSAEIHSDLSYFQVWRDARPRRNVLALEPSNCDRADDGTSGPGTRLEPGDSWQTRLTYTFSSASKGE